MKKYMLDTNICIHLIRKHPPEIVEKFDTFRKGEIVISSITWAELCCGIQKDGSAIVEELCRCWMFVCLALSKAACMGN